MRKYRFQGGSNGFLARMGLGEPFYFHPIVNFHRDSSEEEPEIDYKTEIMMIILSVNTAGTSTDLIMKCKTFGLLPDGVKHGTYTLRIDQDTEVIDEIPEEMFERKE
jgi:hypothetical protein